MYVYSINFVSFVSVPKYTFYFEEQKKMDF